MHDGWQCIQRLNVIPIADVIVVKVQEFERLKALEHFGRRQIGDLIIAQINLFQITETL